MIMKIILIIIEIMIIIFYNINKINNIRHNICISKSFLTMPSVSLTSFMFPLLAQLFLLKEKIFRWTSLNEMTINWVCTEVYGALLYFTWSFRKTLHMYRSWNACTHIILEEQSLYVCSYMLFFRSGIFLLSLII